MLALVVTVSSTSAAFTATQPVDALLESGRVELSAGDVSSLTFGGADLSAIGPGTTLTQSVTVTNASTVTFPTAYTEIALWADTTGAPIDSAGLGAALTVQVVRTVGGGTPETIYSGSFSGLASATSFAAPIGSLWRSRNAGSLTGLNATRAVYTFTISLPASATSGANSSTGIKLVFEARNVTS
ncbi:MAG: hypothetical protein DWI49_04325 [Chloroflexi bacterium]|nr:MAG: hypothetical protein DWI49_04325 [Chloroflexota bacterium]